MPGYGHAPLEPTQHARSSAGQALRWRGAASSGDFHINPGYALRQQRRYSCAQQAMSAWRRSCKKTTTSSKTSASRSDRFAELGPTAQQDIYKKSSIDLALRDAFRKMRSFLMTTKGLTEDEAISLMSIEISLAALETRMKELRIQVILHKQKNLAWPVAETDSHPSSTLCADAHVLTR